MHLCLRLAPPPTLPPPPPPPPRPRPRSRPPPPPPPPSKTKSIRHRYHHNNNSASSSSLLAERALWLNSHSHSHSHSESLLLSAGLSPAQVSRLFTSHPMLLTHPFHHSLRFLSHLFPPPSLPYVISRCPGLLSAPVPSQLYPALLFLRRLSVPITPATSLLLASHLKSTLLPKLHFLLHSLHLPFHDVRSILCRFPRLLTYSLPNNLHPKAHFLQHHMHLHVPTEIRRFPQYFAFNLENRIKRRHRLLLQTGFRMSLREMLTTCDADFDQRILDRKLQLLDRIILTRHNTTTS